MVGAAVSVGGPDRLRRADRPAPAAAACSAPTTACWCPPAFARRRVRSWCSATCGAHGARAADELPVGAITALVGGPLFLASCCAAAVGRMAIERPARARRGGCRGRRSAGCGVAAGARRRRSRARARRGRRAPGPNGAGKTTLLRASRACCGLRRRVRASRGATCGAPRRELARRIAVVPQESRFGSRSRAARWSLMGRHPHLAGLAFESAADVAMARAALERCGALQLAERPIHELSAGERQRVVFARALAQDAPGPAARRAGELPRPRAPGGALRPGPRARAGGAGGARRAPRPHLAAEYCDRLVLLAGGTGLRRRRRPPTC